MIKALRRCLQNFTESIPNPYQRLALTYVGYGRIQVALGTETSPHIDALGSFLGEFVSEISQGETQW
jgi:hypothetical protein